jgi:NAD(P)-dependent dehydrogenase (short-subunit alcohol dehydrogenase family)
MRLEGKVALISGGARGMGAVEAVLFAEEGAKVVIGDLLEAEGRTVADSIPDGNAAFIRLDVTSEDDWQAAVALAVQRYGKLDVLVNNAGVGATSMIEETTVAEWDRVMDINAKGVFLGTKYAIPEMRRAGGGSIINISSQLGLVGMDVSSPQYQASKGAVRLFTKSTAIQHARDGIRCNSVHPGTIETLMTAPLLSDADYRQDRVDRTPLGRLGTPEDVAFGVLFLASDEASFMTGSELVIDGGRTAE